MRCTLRLAGLARFVSAMALCLSVPACAAKELPASYPSAPPDWQSPLGREHPLVGRIWEVAGARFVDQAALEDRVSRARFVAVGEQHDNPDHHALEALLLQAASARRRPEVVFEMIDADDQPAVNRAEAAHPGDPDAIGAAVDWSHSGWPPFAIYRPVFAAAAERGLSVIGGGLEHAVVHRIAHEGVGVLPAELVQRFGLGTPLDPASAAALRKEMSDVHCGMLPESMLDPMALIQRSRDAELALRMSEADPEQGAVLVAGNGHVRSDRGVPRVLERVTHEPVVAVGLLEVSTGWNDPARYAAAFDAATLPFDYVWFTPRISDADHCAELEKKR